MNLRFFLTIIVIVLLPAIGLFFLIMQYAEKVYDYRKKHHVSR
jgi:hypothetical protein